MLRSIASVLVRLLIILMTLIGPAACRSSVPAPSVPKRPPTPPGIQTPLAVIPFTIQVGAFSTTARAARYAAGLRSRGLDAYYFIDIDGLCKVRFESYTRKAAAQRRATALVSRGVVDDYYIVQPGASSHRGEPLLALRKSIALTAHRFIGTPYRWGGESAKSGFDCSGLTMTVFRLNGLLLPRNSRAQFDAGHAVSQKDLQTGDLVFFATGRRGRVSHVGVYIGQSRFIHAPGQGKHIRSASLNSGYFKTRYMGARRYF